ncbi:hypothetical protein G6F60_015063 [Rhizopus arrhizus]|nr:hypothetical protein G6F60_015063 [Rhizopus arrhizus]
MGGVVRRSQSTLHSLCTWWSPASHWRPASSAGVAAAGAENAGAAAASSASITKFFMDSPLKSARTTHGPSRVRTLPVRGCLLRSPRAGPG